MRGGTQEVFIVGLGNRVTEVHTARKKERGILGKGRAPCYLGNKQTVPVRSSKRKGFHQGDSNGSRGGEGITLRLSVLSEGGEGYLPRSVAPGNRPEKEATEKKKEGAFASVGFIPSPTRRIAPG